MCPLAAELQELLENIRNMVWTHAEAWEPGWPDLKALDRLAAVVNALRPFKKMEALSVLFDDIQAGTVLAREAYLVIGILETWH